LDPFSSAVYTARWGTLGPLDHLLTLVEGFPNKDEKFAPPLIVLMILEKVFGKGDRSREL